MAAAALANLRNLSAIICGQRQRTIRGVQTILLRNNSVNAAFALISDFFRA